MKVLPTTTITLGLEGLVDTPSSKDYESWKRHRI